MMGSTKDPEDGGAVSASIFIAVAVYAVSAIKVVRNKELIGARVSWCSAVSKLY